MDPGIYLFGLIPQFPTSKEKRLSRSVIQAKNHDGASEVSVARFARYREITDPGAYCTDFQENLQILPLIRLSLAPVI